MLATSVVLQLMLTRTSVLFTSIKFNVSVFPRAVFTTSGYVPVSIMLCQTCFEILGVANVERLGHIVLYYIHSVHAKILPQNWSWVLMSSSYVNEQHTYSCREA